MLSAHVAGITVALFVAVLTPVTAQSTYPMKALTGSDVILPCDYDQTADGDWIIVTWTVRIGGTFQNLYVRTPGSTTNTVASPPPQFAGRMAIDGISNLRLTGVTIADEDEYRCIVTAQTLSPTTFVNLQVFQQPPTVPIVQVQFDPLTSSMSEVPLNTTVTFTCTSTGGRPPANLGWAVTEDGTVVSVNPTYTSSNNSQGVGDATSTFNFTTTKYGTRYSVQCTASGPDPIQPRTSALTSITTEKDPSAIPTTPKGQTVVTSDPNTASKSPDSGFSNAPQTGGLSSGAQAGLGVGIALGCIALAGVLAYFFVVKRKKRAGRDKDDGVESGGEDFALQTAPGGHPGAPENLSRPPPNEPEVMYAELDLKNAPAGSRRPYVATPDDSPTEYAQIRPDKPPRSSVPHTLGPDNKTEYASISRSKPGRRDDLQAV